MLQSKSTVTRSLNQLRYPFRRLIVETKGSGHHSPTPSQAWCNLVCLRQFQCLVARAQDASAPLVDSPGRLVSEELPGIRQERAAFAQSLPTVCPGCGALSQVVEPDAPGFFTQQNQKRPSERHLAENKVYQEAMTRLNSSETTLRSAPQLGSAEDIRQLRKQEQVGLDADAGARSICDRCHDLVYQSKGVPIQHPSMESIREIIEASPYQRNHIYHVVDAADFPMSLIPNLTSSLNLPRLRTQNRRSKSTRYNNGRTADVSFIITRSDLLAPRKEQVDHMMPYLQEVLREALGRSGKNLRLGNVRCVSAKRGWWTPSVKQDIWDRGGAGWVVGKVNVGKSALFEAVFPKGRAHGVDETTKLATVRNRQHEISRPCEQNDVLPAASIVQANTFEVEDSISDATEAKLNPGLADESEQGSAIGRNFEDDVFSEEDDVALLPPAQPEAQYPQMPIVSALPGTTASPIRIPFGKGRGELIDLPGIQRTSMQTHVQPDRRASLVMKSRVVPEQYTLKPGQSLLIGGMIRITPRSDDLAFLAYPFTTLQAHVTGNLKAIAIQTGMNEDMSPYSGNIESIATAAAKQRIKSAGTFQLQWDVTKVRAGPLTAKEAGGIKPDNLPFAIYSTDILIETVGWVELVCQVRKRLTTAHDMYPEVEVFTPKGKFVAARKPMNAWVLGGPNTGPKHLRKPRPRMSISTHKRRQGGMRAGQKSNAIAA